MGSWVSCRQATGVGRTGGYDHSCKDLAHTQREAGAEREHRKRPHDSVEGADRTHRQPEEGHDDRSDHVDHNNHVAAVSGDDSHRDVGYSQHAEDRGDHGDSRQAEHHSHRGVLVAASGIESGRAGAQVESVICQVLNASPVS